MKRIYLIGLLVGIPSSLAAVFIPLLAQELGASFWEIGLIVAIFGLAKMVSSFLFGRMSDLLGNRKFFVAIGLLASSVGFFMHVFMDSVPAIFAVRFAAAFAMGIFSFPMIAYISKLEHYKEAIGKYSGVTAFGWFLGNILAALILSYFYIFILSGVFFFLAFLVSRELPDDWDVAMVVPRFPVKMVKKNLPIYLSFFFRHIGFHAMWPMLTVYMMTLGADKFWIAAIFSLNGLFQLFTMDWAGKFSVKHDEANVIRAGLVFGLLAMALLFVITDFFYIAFVMVLVSVAWGFLWVGSLIYLTERNAEKSTSTGILGSFEALATVIGPILGGLITQAWGFQAVFLFAAVMCGVGLMTSAWIKNYEGNRFLASLRVWRR